jgi:hypothetical protein
LGKGASWRAGVGRVRKLAFLSNLREYFPVVPSENFDGPHVWDKPGLSDLSRLFRLSRLFGCLVSLGQATKQTR